MRGVFNKGKQEMAKKGSGATARTAQKPAPMVALYGLDEGTPRGDAVRSVLRDLGIRVRTIAPEHLGNPVGAIAGMPGMRPSRNAFEGQMPRDEFMLVCPMPNALFNEMLAAMREANVSIAHKAQVTPHNRLWPVHVLMAEIAKEHAAMTQNVQ